MTKLQVDLRSDLYGFWLKPDLMWPPDGPGMVFLGRAIQQVGERCFADEWTGCEGYERFIPELNKVDTSKPEHLELNYAVALLRASSVEVTDAQRLGREPLSEDNWALAQSTYAQARDGSLAKSFKRFLVVLRKTANALATGKLIAYSRHLDGDGEFVRIPIQAWNRESATDSFFGCLYDPDDITENSKAKVPFFWWLHHDDLKGRQDIWPRFVFLEEESLSAWLATLGNSRDGSSTRDAPYPHKDGEGGSCSWMTFEEAEAWIQTRDRSFARECANAPGTRNAARLALWQHDHGDLWVSSESLRPTLLDVLRKGSVRACGTQRDASPGRRVSIPTVEWIDLTFQSTIDGMTATSKNATWTQLAFEEATVLVQFPRAYADLATQMSADREAIMREMDPLLEARWSVPMTLAWITSRDVSAVREQWDEFRARLGMRPSNWDDLEEACEDSLDTLSDAWRQLRGAGEAGEITFSGVDEDGRGGVVDAPLWRGLRIACGKYGLECHPVASDRQFRLVTAGRAAVISKWPSHRENCGSQDQPVNAKKSRRSAEAIIRSVLEAWVADGAELATRPTQDDVIARVKGERPDESRNSIREAFAQVQREFPRFDWSRRGPRPPKRK